MLAVGEVAGPTVFQDSFKLAGFLKRSLFVDFGIWSGGLVYCSGFLGSRANNSFSEKERAPIKVAHAPLMMATIRKRLSTRLKLAAPWWRSVHAPPAQSKQMVFIQIVTIMFL